MEREKSGTSVVSTVIRLAVLSVVVGVVLSALNIRPDDLVRHVVLIFDRLRAMGFGAVEWAIRYFLLGAVVVVPIWAVTRLLSLGSKRDDDRRG